MNNEIRKKSINNRNAIEANLRQEYEETIYKKIIESDEYKEADVVFVYVARQGETDTTRIIENAVAMDKRICVPKVIADGYMEFYEINSMNQLEVGYKDILEPDDNCMIRFPDEFDNPLVICPMVAFDDEMNRVGSGKGFFDRYLAKYKNVKKIGIAYSCQKSDNITVGPYDIKMDKIITEK